jgi:hypothetical protein
MAEEVFKNLTSATPAAETKAVVTIPAMTYPPYG